MQLSALLNIRPGITSIIGSGGKSTMLRILGTELSRHSRVILTTTTHILPFADIPLLRCLSAGDALPQNPDRTAGSADTFCRPELSALESAFAVSPILQIGTPLMDGSGKLTAPSFSFKELCNAADYILVEADGSRHFPVKAHAAWEPVIPEGSRCSITVIGASGFGKPLSEVCHRPEIFMELLGITDPSVLLTGEMAAQVLIKEALSDIVFLNQTDTADPGETDCFLKNIRIRFPFAAGSLLKQQWNQ